jgi:hypothetical protein
MPKKHIYEDAHEAQKQPLSVRTFGSAPLMGETLT